MPHQCVKCSTIYPDNSAEILSGCSCGGKFFFYIKKEKLNEAKEVIFNLTHEERQQIEEDVKELIERDDEIQEDPVVLDFESIRILKPGKYEIDLVQLFKKEPVIIKLDEGKYIVDVAESFRGVKQRT
ncbi:MAG TPA: Zn-ribbon containing protein [Candidatus Nanoarchaeia archaeon]|nr:Zn-ribbon containing protein [Candidatus Nanoarchaeia archaeon]